MKNPWEGMPSPIGNETFTYQLADPDHPLDFYWARDKEGCFAFRFRGEFDQEATAEAPDMSGVRCYTETLDEHTYFNLVLESLENADIFLFICNSLLRVTKSLNDGEDRAGLRIVVQHLQRWQDILKAGRSRSLSETEQLGLYGELIVLRDVFLANLPPSEAVMCWTGPFPDEQDFGYSGNLVEVKTSRSTRDSSFSVSSFDQLDTSSGNVSLVFQTVAIFEDAPPNAVTLNQLVHGILELLGNNLSASSEFLTRLKLMKYTPEPQYDKRSFVLVSRRFFDVVEQFPRIERRDLRSGIARGSYTVKVEACLPYECESEKAVQAILSDIPDADLEVTQIAIEDFVRLPESTELEYKSSLRWSYQENKVNKILESVVLKSIVALANTRGGKLIIGISDDGEILGLTKDYETLKTQHNSDGFELHLNQILEATLGPTFVSKSVHCRFHTLQGKEICEVTVAKHRPIQPIEKVTKTGKQSVFYVRVGNSSRELPAREIIQYNQST